MIVPGDMIYDMAELDSNLKQLSDLLRSMKRPLMGPGRRRWLVREARELVKGLSIAGEIARIQAYELASLSEAVKAWMPLEETQDQHGHPHRLNHGSITKGKIEAFGLIEPAARRATPSSSRTLEEIASRS